MIFKDPVTNKWQKDSNIPWLDYMESHIIKNLDAYYDCS